MKKTHQNLRGVFVVLLTLCLFVGLSSNSNLCRAALKLFVTGIPGDVYQVQSQSAVDGLTNVLSGELYTNLTGVLELNLTNQITGFLRIKMVGAPDPTNISQVAALAIYRGDGDSNAVAEARVMAERFALRAIAEHKSVTATNQLEAIFTSLATAAAGRAAQEAQTANSTNVVNEVVAAATRVYAALTNALPLEMNVLPPDAQERIQISAALNGALLGIISAGAGTNYAQQIAQQAAQNIVPSPTTITGTDITGAASANANAIVNIISSGSGYVTTPICACSSAAGTPSNTSNGIAVINNPANDNAGVKRRSGT